MANMTYCRFENTLRDFQDCLDAITGEEGDGLDHDQETLLNLLSKSERKAAANLAKLAKEYLNVYNFHDTDTPGVTNIY